MWALSLVTVPLLVGLIGWSESDRSNKQVPLTLPAVDPSATLAAPANPVRAVAPLSVRRSGNTVTLDGEVPDVAVRTALFDSLRGTFGPRITFAEHLNVKPGVNPPNLRPLGSVLGTAVDVRDFDLAWAGEDVTLGGTATSESARSGVEAAAKSAWPNMKIANNIRVQGATPQAAGPACGGARTAAAGLLRTPVNFSTDGSAVPGGSRQMLTQVAERLKECPGVRVTVDGYTDSTGNDAINLALSSRRAKSVADYLVSHGIAGDHVRSNGLGAANPVASNATPGGRAQNRRVQITIS